jgi:phosphate transport system substrate-binding protein
MLGRTATATALDRIAGIFLATLLILSSLVAQASAQSAGKAEIRISGSDTMNLLSGALAEEYRKGSPGVAITVTGGGSARGITDMMSGLNDICQSSRPLTPDEIKRAKDAGLAPHEYIIGIDGLAVFVHKDNPISELSMNQVRAIFTGAVKNWKEVGGPDLPITLYAREANSGTYHYFKEHALKKSDYAPNTNHMAGSAAVCEAVAKDRAGVGFSGIGYAAHLTTIKVVGLRTDRNSPVVSPLVGGTHKINEDVIQDGTYPLARPLQYFTPKAPSDAVQAFLDWVMSDEGQAVVRKMEYVPLAPAAREKTGKPVSDLPIPSRPGYRI